MWIKPLQPGKKTITTPACHHAETTQHNQGRMCHRKKGPQDHTRQYIINQGIRVNTSNINLNNNIPEGRNEITVWHKNMEALLGALKNIRIIIWVISGINTGQ